MEQKLPSVFESNDGIKTKSGSCNSRQASNNGAFDTPGIIFSAI